MTEARYSLMRGGEPGSWLLLTDDGRTLFHLTQYDEDGSAEDGATGKPIRGRFWRACKLMKDTGWHGDVPRPVQVVERNIDGEIVELDRHLVIRAGEWDEWRCMARTRRELVEELSGYVG